MPNIDVRISHLSKKYVLKQSKGYKTLRDSIILSALSPFKKSAKRAAKRVSSDEDMWALRNINIEIQRGDVVGIVGRNGAGKSTLLKILTRIIEPTEGHAEIRGKTTSLLEVGTGFHQELTGRENIYLNGSILGMKRNEINRRFDEIVDFSGVSKFLDTPVKHYSTGMRVRLAFSVAAHLRPDILFIDEVLAVGDFEFQQKCLSKMKEVASDGRTVLFVSHNLASIKEMCDTCIFLEGGELKYHGPVDEGLAMYFSSFTDESAEDGLVSGWRNIRIEVNGEDSSTINREHPFSVRADINLAEDFLDGHFFFKVKASTGNAIVRERVNWQDLFSGSPVAGRYHVGVDLPALWLAPGIYVVHFWFTGSRMDGEEKRCQSPQVMLNVAGSFRGLDYSRVLLYPPVHWNVDCKPASIRERKVQGS